jgi:hypothetical protein
MAKVIWYGLAGIVFVLALPAILFCVVLVPVFLFIAWWLGRDVFAPWYVQYHVRFPNVECWIPVSSANDIFGWGRGSVEGKREAVLEFKVVDPRIPEGGTSPVLPAERRKWWSPVF